MIGWIWKSGAKTRDVIFIIHLLCYCSMEFSMTEQQVPMFLRLLVLLSALQQKQLKSSIDIQDNSSASQENKGSIYLL